MRQHRTTKLFAGLAGLALLAAACGDDGDEETEAGADDEETTTTEGEEGEDVEANPATDRLVIGRVAPETGPLGFLGPPQIQGINLAVEDINAAGGVLGQDVDLLTADEGETPDTAREGAVRLLGEGANVIVGAAASGSSQAFIQILSDNQIPQCSGSNTSPDFTEQEDTNADYYFRTVPPDNAVAPIIADTVVADGHQSAAVVARADDYGEALASLVEENLTEAGVDVVANPTYDPEAASFDSEVEDIVGAEPDAVVVIAFDEGGDLIAGLVERGMTPDQFYGSDGIFSPTLPELVDPNNANVIDGMTVVGAAGNEEFNDRIAEATQNNFIYGGQVYDCGIVMALAAEKAQSVAGDDILAEIQNVTGGDGETCSTYEDCKALLDEGEEINYDGASGPLDLDEVGDPTAGLYAIGQYEDGTLTIVDSQEAILE